MIEEFGSIYCHFVRGERTPDHYKLQRLKLFRSVGRPCRRGTTSFQSYSSLYSSGFLIFSVSRDHCAMSGAPQTPGNRPRISGLPTPGHRSVSGLPTPSRSRSAAGAYKDVPLENDTEAMRALSEAIRANDPSLHRSNLDGLSFGMGMDRQSSVSRASSSNITAPRASTSSLASSVASSINSYAFDRSTSTVRPKTPASATSSIFRSTQTPRSSTTTVSTRPASRTSDVFGRASSRLSSRHAPSYSGVDRPVEVGDYVRIDSLDVEGTVRFLGETKFKAGVWAGVELSASDVGKGKNDGTVSGYVSRPLLAMTIRI